MVDGNIAPRAAWEMPFPQVLALLSAWAKHPPLRYMVSVFLEFHEGAW